MCAPCVQGENTAREGLEKGTVWPAGSALGPRAGAAPGEQPSGLVGVLPGGPAGGTCGAAAFPGAGFVRQACASRWAMLARNGPCPLRGSVETLAPCGDLKVKASWAPDGPLIQALRDPPSLPHPKLS